jgi:hypothetical protein
LLPAATLYIISWDKSSYLPSPPHNWGDNPVKTVLYLSKNSGDNTFMSQQKTLIDQYRNHLAPIGKSAHTVKAKLLSKEYVVGQRTVLLDLLWNV